MAVISCEICAAYAALLTRQVLQGASAWEKGVGNEARACSYADMAGVLVCGLRQGTCMVAHACVEVSEQGC